ncbi:MAG: GntR family transcriptional regulator [Hyphomicrobiales bacterium]|nr:GntR family transcriptional regulator [Hyphomicrobiales bacterium]
MSEAFKLDSIARRFAESSGPPRERVPKYLRLSDAVLDVIESGEYRPGSRIPGEKDLSNSLPLSLGTVQKAMNDLVDQGVLIRRAGKGTFVSGAGHVSNEQKVEKCDLVHFRFRAEPGGALLPVFLQVESIGEIARSRNGALKPWERFLAGGGSFVRVDRILTVSDLFSGFCRFYLPFEHYGSLLDRSCEELSGVTLREYLNQTYNMPTLRFEHQILTDELPGDVCSKLKLGQGSYGTVWHIFGRTYRNAPASYQIVYLPAGHRPIELLERLE